MHENIFLQIYLLNRSLTIRSRRYLKPGWVMPAGYAGKLRHYDTVSVTGEYYPDNCEVIRWF